MASAPTGNAPSQKNPVGTSTAITVLVNPFKNPTSCLYAPSIGLFNPEPNKASIIKFPSSLGFSKSGFNCKTVIFKKLNL